MASPTSFDTPIFKVLANNDTGASTGHQGGFVLPKELEDFLPLLRNATTALRPTVDIEITAELFDGSSYLGTVETRYQYQTWGGTRSPERRVTSNLSGLLNSARGGDILLIQRGIEDDTHYRFRLIKQENPHYTELSQSIGNLRWGPLYVANQPIKETEVVEAVAEIENASATAFAMFDEDAEAIESRSRRISRSRAFKRVVFGAYESTCAICGGGLLHPDGRSELEAGHIVSRSLKGSDDVRNGLLLCRGHHWAFDVGLVGVTDSYEVIVPTQVGQQAGNASLGLLHGASIRLPNDVLKRPALEALAWHRANVLIA